MKFNTTRLRYLATAFLFVISSAIYAQQIIAPGASDSFATNYSSAYQGSDDIVYIFCGDQSQNDIGELEVSNASGCSVEWFEFDGVSYQPLGVTGSTASSLESGGYMAQVDCSGNVTCLKAWVWVNQTHVDIDPITPSCQQFDLSGDIDQLDSTFTIVDPPGLNFAVDASTEITVCFWGDHTYVSDLGFYLKAPGHETDEPQYPPVQGSANNAVVELLPPVSDWGPSAAQGSWTGVPGSNLGCSNSGDINTNCQGGNNFSNFCFTTNLPAEDPAYTPCVCDMPVPLSGTFASVADWNAIYGYNAGDAGWSIQIYDCEEYDYGSLNRALITFTGSTECGQTTFTYDSGDISGLPSSDINDNSCSATTASYFVVPPQNPPGAYDVTSSITGYNWSCDGSPFTNSSTLNPTLVPGTSDYPDNTSNFYLNVTETIDVPSSPTCQQETSEEFVTLPSDATISPIPPLCSNDAPYTIQVADQGGTFTLLGGTNPNALDNGVFYPDIAGPGTHEVVYTISGACPDDDTAQIAVYENIEVVNLTDTTCDATNDYFTVVFDVYDLGGAPAQYQVDTGAGFYTMSAGQTFSEQFASPGNYAITVTDMNGCDMYELVGYTDCGCDTYAGTMDNLQLQNLCEGQCTGSYVSHNNDHVSDGNDILEFILHDGSVYPADETSIVERSSTPDFCFQPATMYFDTTYYVSPICGDVDPNDPGHVVDTPANDPCYSQGSGTPIVWNENPIVSINQNNISVCGLSVTLEGSDPGSGVGTWTADSTFYPAQGTSINDSVMTAIVNDYMSVDFTWTVDNNGCTGSDDITVNFNPTPTAFAGNDTTVCGNQVQLDAQFSLSGSSGQWSAPGISFSSASSENAIATLNGSYGTHVLTWTETMGTCSDDDYINVTFVQNPQPTITNNSDTVCGLSHTLEVSNVIGNGQWYAYDNGSQINPYWTPGNTSPTSNATINNYGGNHYRTINFEWVETNAANSVQCVDTVYADITFAEEPFANADDGTSTNEVCGNTYSFNADTSGYGWTEFNWIANGATVNFGGEENLPDATVVVPPGSFGDSASVQIDFIWTSTNGGCSDLDTLPVTFFEVPQANAGLNDSICGLKYPLGAVYNLPEAPSYTPSGEWEDLGSNPSTANFTNPNTDSTMVNVNASGMYGFVWREKNSNNASCTSRDTVWIEFKEEPVIDAGNDFDVCGTEACLNGLSAGNPGNWLNEPGVIFDDPSIDTTCINYVQGYGSVDLIWQEANDECTAKDTVTVTFWRKPTANLSMDPADTVNCGNTFTDLRAENPGSGVNGNWIAYPSNGVDFYQQNFSDTMEVSYYGEYDIVWVESNHPANEPPSFCADTSEIWTIDFIEEPVADANADDSAGTEIIFCGKSGNLNAEFSVDSSTGLWADLSGNIDFDSITDPQSTISSPVYTAGNSSYDHFMITWTEVNKVCTDSDTAIVGFSKIPEAEMTIIPPRCKGEPASIKAQDDTLSQYYWEFNGGLKDSLWVNASEYRKLVHWENEDTAHIIGLTTENYWGCTSNLNQDTVFEPPVPYYELTVAPDTCLFGLGGVRISTDSANPAFEWVDTTGTGITNTDDTVQTNIPAGEYRIVHEYTTPNQVYSTFYNNIFGTDVCRDTFKVEIDTVGMIEADFEIASSIDIETLVAPSAQVIFNNISDSDELNTSSSWNFDDGNTETNNEEQVEHVYTEPKDCYQPYLVVYSRDLPECRDTAYHPCIKVDDRSSLEAPNVFTPNGDGMNDFFQVEAQTLKTFEGKILNRWGHVIYKWNDFETEEAGWDGKINGGSEASSGVYYYIINAKGIDGYEYEKQGSFHLIKAGN